MNPVIEDIFYDVYEGYNLQIVRGIEQEQEIFYLKYCNETVAIFYIEGNIIKINRVSSKWIKAELILKKLIIFFKMVNNNLDRINEQEPTFSKVDKLVICGDLSVINFDTEEQDLYPKLSKKGKVLNTRFYIELNYLNILTYGKTWYNRVGYGSQNEEWDLFIKRDFIEFLREINYPKIDLWTDYETCSIKEVFGDVIDKLKRKTKYTRGNIRIVEKSDLPYLEKVKQLVDFIFSYDDLDEKDDPFYIYVPRVDGDTECII